MPKIKVLGISGSPRRGGNSEILLDRCLESARKAGADTEKFVLNQMKFVPCQECAVITKDGRCKIKDDMQKIYPAVEHADAVVVASPVFFGSVSAQTKMMIDRFQCQWLGLYFYKSYVIPKRKQGAFISVAGTDRKDFFDNSKAIVKNFFVTIGTSYRYEIFCPLTDEKGAVNHRPDCIAEAEKIGKLLGEK
jgi:multimeric flavodoxin WrbA